MAPRKPPSPTIRVPLMRSLPAWRLAGLTDPVADLRRLGLVHRTQLHVARAFAERRRRVELRPAEEHDVDRDIVGRDLDHPALLRQAVERALPLHRVLEPRNFLADRPVEVLDDRLQRRHHGLDPVRDVLVAGARLGRLAGRVRFEFLRHAISPCVPADAPGLAWPSPQPSGAGIPAFPFRIPPGATTRSPAAPAGYRRRSRRPG